MPRLRDALLLAPLLLFAFGAPGLASNPIVLENQLQGSPPSVWDIELTDDPGIAGFATEFSRAPGESVEFKISTDSSDYRLDIYRMGYYAGDGARLVASVNPHTLGPQPACQILGYSMLDCGNWLVSAEWTIPSTAVTGIYFAKLVREDPVRPGENHAFFVVRETTPRSDLLFQTSDTTWQAYNAWSDDPANAYGLYDGPAWPYRSLAVSYNRPLEVHTTQRSFRDGWHGIFAAEYPMVRFLERNGYDVSYFSGADSERRGEEIALHRVFLSVGHDEYWSAGQRARVEEARDAGTHLAFFNGNSVYWKTYWEDGHRTLVCAKETQYRETPDPPWTGLWRNPGAGQPGRPENELTGTLKWNYADNPMWVPEAMGKLRFWRHTRFADLTFGEIGISTDNVVGYEWQTDDDNGYRPEGLIRLSSTPANPQNPVPFAPRHHLTLHRRQDSGVLVFGAGTMQWSWGLDGPDPGNRLVIDGANDDPPDPALQQATVNLLADMDVQPLSLQSGLVQAAASGDSSGPQITAVEVIGLPLRIGELAFIIGAAEDVEGEVAGVELYIDGGWHPASGGATWVYLLVPSAAGTFQIAIRGIDDSANIGPATPLLAQIYQGNPLECGNGVRDGDEHCDAADDAVCPGACSTLCTCTNLPYIDGEGRAIPTLGGGPGRVLLAVALMTIAGHWLAARRVAREV